MAKYKAPGIAVHQTIQQNVSGGLVDQNVALVGPNATLILYNTTETEREKSNTGRQFINGQENLKFRWQRNVGDNFVDYDYTKVYFRNALLGYGTADIKVVDRRYNQVDVDLASADFLGNRDIRVGDVIRFDVFRGRENNSDQSNVKLTVNWNAFSVDTGETLMGYHITVAWNNSGVADSSTFFVGPDTNTFNLVNNVQDILGNTFTFADTTEYAVTKVTALVETTISAAQVITPATTWPSIITDDSGDQSATAIDVSWTAFTPGLGQTISGYQITATWDESGTEKTATFLVENYATTFTIENSVQDINGDVFTFNDETEYTITEVAAVVTTVFNENKNITPTVSWPSITTSASALDIFETFTSPILFIEDVIKNNTVNGTAVAASTNGKVLDGTDIPGYSTPTISVSGNFTGTKNTTYVLDVVKGGTVGSEPIIRVRTQSGDDTVEDITITSSGSSYALGTRGLEFSIEFTELIQGESFTFPVEVVGVTGEKRLTLQRNIYNTRAELLSAQTDSISANFHVVRHFQVNERSSAGAVNYSQNNEELTILGPTIIAEDFDFVDVSGRYIPLQVTQADVYIEQRVWNFSGNIAASFGVVSNTSELELALPGVLHPDNPLKYGIYKSLQNAGGQSVIYAVVDNPNEVESWKEAFNRLSKNRNAYAVVPLTFNDDVKRACVNFVMAESTDEINRRKECWIHQAINSEISVVTYSDDDPTFARIEDDPNSDGIIYDYVIDERGKFIELGVRAGDEFRTNYRTSMDGLTQYDKYVVQRVINDTTLIINTDVGRAVNIQQKYEVWRSTTFSNFEENIGKLNVWNNRRVIAVHPFTVHADGHQNIPGYYGAAMVASVTVSLPPNIASTLRPVQGIDALDGMENFSETNLNSLALSGVTILTKDENDSIYIRHTLTTGNPDIINEREEMTTRNFDNISNFYTAALMRLRGRITATVEGLTAVFDSLQKASEALLLRYRDEGVSGQIVSYAINNISIDPVFHDVVNCHIDLELPHMANRIELYLQVLAETSAIGTVLSAATTSLTENTRSA